MNNSILVIDDDKDMCLLLNRFLTRNNFIVSTFHTGKEATEWLRKNEPDIILCDFKLDDINGVELLAQIKETHPAVPVIIITGYSDVKNAVEVMKLGAYDYVTKPLLPDEILLTIKNALNADNFTPAKTIVPKRETQNVNEKPAPVKNKIKSKTDSQYVMGETPEFVNIMKQIELVAPTNFSIIIYGESGSGKEAIAQQIHEKSKRNGKPFVAIDCGALSKDLAGSELFGHEKGAFTGAINQKLGSFEVANGGTIFLDEIANLSYDIQVSLLRVVQERKMRRVGGNKDIELDVRIIVASNERLWDAAKEGKFREDLYHRFNEFSIEVPPLRKRRKDIMLFAQHFLDITNSELEKNIQGFSKEVINIFQNYVWHGNLRELKNVVKRATLLTDGNYIEAISLPFEITNYNKLNFHDEEKADEEIPMPAKSKKITKSTEVSFDKKLKTANMDAEYEVILDALKQADYNKSKAAKLLNIDRKTLYNKMKQFKEFNLD